MAYTHSLILTLVFMTMLICVDAARSGHSTRNGASSSEDDASCDASIDELVNNCKAYVVPGLLMGSLPVPSNPSPCCSSVQSAQFPCICSRATGPVMSFVDKQAVKNVLEACEVIVPSGTTCGGITWN